MRLSRDNVIVLGILAVLGTTFFLVVHRTQSAALAKVRTDLAERKRQIDADAVHAAGRWVLWIP